jgi:hypothetical protein
MTQYEPCTIDRAALRSLQEDREALAECRADLESALVAFEDVRDELDDARIALAEARRILRRWVARDLPPPVNSEMPVDAATARFLAKYDPEGGE